LSRVIYDILILREETDLDLNVRIYTPNAHRSVNLLTAII